MLAPVLGLLLLGLVIFAIAYLVIGIPEPNRDAASATSIIYWADGTTELDRMSAVNREPVPLADIPQDVKHAVIAAEDRGFYDNPGVSFTGVTRAVWVAATGGDTQGGSTITQQYVKNYFLTQDRTLTRKGRELIISLKVEQQQSKDQILENYLNTIYYGRGASGIKTAAKAYFDKPLNELTRAESVFLAAVIRAPSLYDPGLGADNETRARDRFRYVLDGMVEKGWLAPEERATTSFPQARAGKTAVTDRSDPNGYLTDMVRKELVAKGVVTEDELSRGGLRIVTTVDKDMQQKAIDAVDKRRPQSGRGKDVHVALAAVKPGDGAVLALYGGADYREQQFNDATQGTIQAGSTFKPFTLVAALRDKVSTRTIYNGRNAQRIDGFPEPVVNFGNANYGNLTLKQATAKSCNTIYARLNEQIGPKKSKQAAIDLGLPDSTPGLEENPANVFGTASVSPLDMANAYATLAAKGQRATPYLVRSVTTEDEAFRYDAEPELRQAIDPGVAADTIDAMETVVQGGGTASGASFGRPVAGKTGTSTSNMSAWFDGFTPQISTSVALFLPDKDGNPQPMRGVGGLSEVTGGSYPVRIWRAFMRDAHEGMEVQRFPDRAGIGDSEAKDYGIFIPTPTMTRTDGSTDQSTGRRDRTTDSRTSSSTRTSSGTSTSTRTSTGTSTRTSTRTSSPTDRTRTSTPTSTRTSTRTTTPTTKPPVKPTTRTSPERGVSVPATLRNDRRGGGDEGDDGASDGAAVPAGDDEDEQ